MKTDPEAEELVKRELERLGVPRRRLFIRKLPEILRVFLLPILFPVTFFRISKGVLGLGMQKAMARRIR